MRQKTECIVITFATTTQAMQMEQYCKERQLPGRIIPVPSQISAGCGLAWKIHLDEQEQMINQWQQANIGWDGVYRVEL